MSELTITIKYGKGYEESWAVFRGEDADSLRSQLMGYFGLTEDVTQGLTLHEVVLQATDIAHGGGAMQRNLGAVPIAQDDDGAPKGAAAWDAAGSVGPAEQKEAVHPHAVLIERLKTAATVDDLKGLWARHKDAFEDEDVKSAYSERGKELTAA